MTKKTDDRNYQRKKAKNQRKKAKNPTTNYSMDSHKYFCKRCFKHHEGVCPITNTNAVSKSCTM